MPFIEVNTTAPAAEDAKINTPIRIFYRIYGRGLTKVLLITGLAGTHDSWGPQIKGFIGTDVPNEDGDRDVVGDRDATGLGEGVTFENGGGIEVCAFDNRGMGRSSVPTKKSAYTTKIMAKDAIALLDHLGWEKAHILGHSMGGMIACKLAAMAPGRVKSLAMLNVTGGGFQCCPKLDPQTFKIAVRFLKAKTPERRASVDLDIHYSKEYVKGISATGMQSNAGFAGQVNACWTHKVTRKEIECLKSAGFLVSVIHGRHDVIAQMYYARRLAEKLYPVARMVDLHGGHLVSREKTEEVNRALLDLIRASEMKTSPHEWTNLAKKRSWWMEERMAFVTLKNEGGGGGSSISSSSSASAKPFFLERLHLFVLYLFGLILFAFEYLWNGLKSLKPVRD
ncbi:uncharacterized protein LOC111430308 isoform X2 [Cucurbita moschata]|uniref:Uncharacterized protein LOC111430308 isoform X2 n=1 Tax=Cucurbita moschata TaxID=3662 RepID=A0A6J1E896_CUCMO|nr:uncharacterized protein LOC111430308 isoform X2 [Cucurbita moschata]